MLYTNVVYYAYISAVYCVLLAIYGSHGTHIHTLLPAIILKHSWKFAIGISQVARYIYRSVLLYNIMMV